MRQINFIEKIIERDLKKGFSKFNLKFRFPPEPNGYLHIGHAKAIFINFFLSKKYNASINLRFDDTNPSKESDIFIDSIKKDINWLGFNWNTETYTSDYFEKLYNWAIYLIKIGKAYVDDQSQEKINDQRGDIFNLGINSPYRNRSIDENISLFIKMKNARFREGSCVLRAKIDMNSRNINLRDPVMYRIIEKKHNRTGYDWVIYPTYDWAHGQSDYIEQISHSLCSIEFKNHRELYNWFLDIIYNKGVRPKQYEFSRLNLSYNVTSKRKLRYLVEKKFVSGWNDPRMPTLSGLRHRGYTPYSINNFCNRIGISKRENLINISLLNFILKKQLISSTIRVMVVLDPLKIVINNYPSDKFEVLKVINNPLNPKLGYRKIIFSKYIYIEKKDFKLFPESNFLRLSLGRKVRLKNAYVIKALNIIKNDKNEILEIHCKYYPDSKSNINKNKFIPSLYNVKSTLHWVSVNQFIKIEVRLYKKLFVYENLDRSKFNFLKFFNNKSFKIVIGYAELFLKNCKIGDRIQFQRIGYFYVDYDNIFKKKIFNAIVSL